MLKVVRYSMKRCCFIQQNKEGDKQKCVCCSKGKAEGGPLTIMKIRTEICLASRKLHTNKILTVLWHFLDNVCLFMIFKKFPYHFWIATNLHWVTVFSTKADVALGCGHYLLCFGEKGRMVLSGSTQMQSDETLDIWEVSAELFNLKYVIQIV